MSPQPRPVLVSCDQRRLVMISCRFTWHENCPDVMQTAPVRLPEVSQLVFPIDQFDAVRKPVMNMFGVTVVEPIATEIAGMYAMQNGLLNARALRMTQEMMRKTGARDTMPQACRMRFGGVVKIQAKCREFAHFSAIKRE